MTKGLVYLGATIGGTIGGYIPVLLGSGGLSGWSLIGGTVGGFVGIWAVYKIFNN